MPFLAAAEFFTQSFEAHDVVVIGLLVVLEGVLSIDNALVLGLLAKRLPRKQQSRALTYGLAGAFVFRTVAVATAAWLLHWRIVKLAGGAYLIYISIKHLFFESKEEAKEQVTLSETGEPVLVEAGTRQPLGDAGALTAIRQRSPVPLVPPVNRPSDDPAECINPDGPRKCASFWPTVLVIELTDIAFAIDSILAAIALVGSAPAGHHGPHPKLWLVLAGGMLGVILMRVAAVLFIRLLERFPRFELAAYLLVIVIGLKLVVDWGFNSEAHPHRVDFHSYSQPAFWIFWLLMVVCFCVGFIPRRDSETRRT
jgi:YkoY family integral membrane protein